MILSLLANKEVPSAPIIFVIKRCDIVTCVVISLTSVCMVEIPTLSPYAEEVKFLVNLLLIHINT